MTDDEELKKTRKEISLKCFLTEELVYQGLAKPGNDFFKFSLWLDFILQADAHTAVGFFLNAVDIPDSATFLKKLRDFNE